MRSSTSNEENATLVRGRPAFKINHEGIGIPPPAFQNLFLTPAFLFGKQNERFSKGSASPGYGNTEILAALRSSAARPPF